MVLWLVPKSLNYMGLDPLMSWGQSTTIFPRNELLAPCGKRALPKCHCGTWDIGESTVSERVSRSLGRIYPNSLGEGGECCQQMSGLGPWFALSYFPEQDILSRRAHTTVDFSWLWLACCVMSVCSPRPSPVKALLSFNKLRLNKLHFAKGKVGISLCTVPRRPLRLYCVKLIW